MIKQIFIVLLSLLVFTSSAFASGSSYQEAEAKTDQFSLVVSKSFRGGIVSAHEVWSTTSLGYNFEAQPGCEFAGTSYITMGGEKHFFSPEATRKTDWLPKVQIQISYDEKSRGKYAPKSVSVAYTMRCGKVVSERVEQGFTLNYAHAEKKPVELKTIDLKPGKQPFVQP